MLCVSLNKKQRPGQQQEVGGGKRWVYSGRTTQGSLSAASEGNNGLRITVTSPLNTLSRSVTPVCQGCPGDFSRVENPVFQLSLAWPSLWYNRARCCPSTSLETQGKNSTYSTQNWQRGFSPHCFCFFHRHASIQHISSKAKWRTRRRPYFKHTSFVCCDNMLCFS